MRGAEGLVISSARMDGSQAEVDFYRQATECLVRAGFDVFTVDCNQRQAEQVAARIHARLTAFLTPPRQANVS